MAVMVGAIADGSFDDGETELPRGETFDQKLCFAAARITSGGTVGR